LLLRSCSVRLVSKAIAFVLRELEMTTLKLCAFKRVWSQLHEHIQARRDLQNNQRCALSACKIATKNNFTDLMVVIKDVYLCRSIPLNYISMELAFYMIQINTAGTCHNRLYTQVKILIKKT